MATVAVQLPPLHTGRNGSGGQVAVEESPARFVICLCGRRWGKTTFGIRKCVKGSIERPGTYWWIGPTYPVANIGWRMLKRLVAQLPGIEVREADRYVTFPNGSEIWIKSADNPDGLRGEKLMGVVFDEMAQIKEEAWTEAVRPALSDTKGWALFIGTPKGKNWVYKLWNMADNMPDWARFKRFTIDNPYIEESEVEAARNLLSPMVFAQEYEADFGASQFLVYPEFSRDIHQWKRDIPKFERFYGGLDFGDASVTAHKSAGNVAGLTANDELIFLAEFEQSGPGIGERQVTWMAETEQKIRRVAASNGSRAREVFWRADATQMWGIQLVRGMGFNITGSKRGKDVRDTRVELVARRLKIRADGRPRLFYLPSLTHIPEAFERYRNPDPVGDDKMAPRGPLKIQDDTMDTILYTVEGVDLGIIGDPAEIYAGVLGRIA